MYRSAAGRSLALLWLSLLVYSALFGLLQKILLPRFGLPGDVSVLISIGVASAVPLAYGAALGPAGTARPRRTPRPGAVIYLFCLAQAGGMTTPLELLYICVLGPVLEELIYRGVVQRRLEPYGARLAVGLSALCFGLVHHDLYQGLSAFLGGLVFGYAALTYGLGLSIGLHIAGNTLAMALPLLREAGTPGALAMLVLLALPGVAAAAGGIRLALRRRRAPVPSVPAAPAAPARAVWADPALWALLLFDVVYLAALSFSRLPG